MVRLRLRVAAESGGWISPPHSAEGSGEITSHTLPTLKGPSEALTEEGEHAIVHGAMVSQLASVVPRRFGDTGGAWHLLFWSAMHGTSLSHLLRCASGAGPCLLLVRDSERRVYGAYCTELREPRSGGQGDSLFYGDGETRLLALSAGGAGAAHTFEWSGRNRHFICGVGGAAGPNPTVDQLVIGAGGACGLMLDRALCRATSGGCDTFDSPPLPLVADGRAAPPPRRSPRNSPRTSATEDEPGVSPELPPPPHAPVEALVETVELWGLDEHACRTMRGACALHVPIRNSMSQASERGLASPSPRCAAGYSVSVCLTPGTASMHAAPR